MIILHHDNDHWRILGQGTAKDGAIFCHLASMTRGHWQKSGWMPIQMNDWIDEKLILSAAIQGEEAKRSGKHPGDCVPWRGRDGALGHCVRCGKPVDALTQHLLDRQSSGQSPLEARP